MLCPAGGSLYHLSGGIDLHLSGEALRSMPFTKHRDQTHRPSNSRNLPPDISAPPDTAC